MSQIVVTGASLKCSFGTTPSIFNATYNPMNLAGGKPIGTIADGKGMVNIPSFGMCTSLANPAVSAATTAALGVLTPQPCVPATAGVWIPSGSLMVLSGGKPCLTKGCKCMCTFGGLITIVTAGQMSVIVK